MTADTFARSALRLALRGKRVMVVASTGGHLSEAHTLSELLGFADDSTWVTFDNEQSRSMLAGRHVVFVPYVAPRDLRGTVRAYRTIARELTQRHYDAVISTGAAIGLSGMLAARRRRIPAAFIESLARLEGPSLTGKLASLLPGVRLFTQHRDWANRHWRFDLSIMDAWAPGSRPCSSPTKIFVTVGTIRPYRFDRLIDGLIACIPDDVEVRWQLGETRRADLPSAASLLDAATFRKNIDWADVVVTHAGVGSILAVLDSGTSTVVIPRRGALNEHVDDHQTQIAADLSRRGLCVVREADDVIWEDLVESTGIATTRM